MIFEDCTNGAWNITIKNGCIIGLPHDQTNVIMGFTIFSILCAIIFCFYLLHSSKSEKVKE